MRIIKNLKKLSLFSGLSWLFLSSPALAVVRTDPRCNKISTSGEVRECVQHNQIIQDLQTIINALSIGVGIIVTGMIIVGGIQYILAGDNPTATAAAKQRIINALIALIAYISLFAIIQWLIPGGVFENTP